MTSTIVKFYFCKKDFSNIDLSEKEPDFSINVENDWNVFFILLNEKIFNYEIIFYSKNDILRKKILSKNNYDIIQEENSNITLNISNSNDLKKLEVLCLILRIRTLFVNYLNKISLDLKYIVGIVNYHALKRHGFSSLRRWRK